MSGSGPEASSTSGERRQRLEQIAAEDRRADRADPAGVGRARSSTHRRRLGPPRPRDRGRDGAGGRPGRAEGRGPGGVGAPGRDRRSIPPRQRATPLQIVRSAYGSRRRCSPPPASRRSSATTSTSGRWPDDDYGLVPEHLSDLGDEDLGPLLLAWGMAKAAVLRSRQARHAGRPDLELGSRNLGSRNLIQRVAVGLPLFVSNGVMLRSHRHSSWGSEHRPHQTLHSTGTSGDFGVDDRADRRQTAVGTRGPELDAQELLGALLASEARLRDQASILEMVAKGMPLDETLTEICRVVEAHIPGGDLRRRGRRSGSRPRASSGSRPPRRTITGPFAIPAFTDGAAARLARGRLRRSAAPDRGRRGGRRAQVVQLAAMAIERDEFENHLAFRATHDPLTGLPNRALFHELLVHALARARRVTRSARGPLHRPRPFQDRQRLARPRSRRRPARRRSRIGCAASCDRATSSRASAVTSSPSCARASIRRRAAVTRSTSPSVCSMRCRIRSTARGRTISSAPASGSRSRRTATSGPRSSSATRTRRCTGRSNAGRAVGRSSTSRCARQARARHEIEDALHRALERNEFRVFYQPVISLQENRYIGVEALLRWQHPERGLARARGLHPSRRGDRAHRPDRLVARGRGVSPGRRLAARRSRR